MTGGRSVRCERRRATRARLVEGEYAPPWSDATAVATMDAIKLQQGKQKASQQGIARWLLTDSRARGVLTSGMKGALSAECKAEVHAIVAHHSASLGAGKTLAQACQSFMKPLWKRAQVKGALPLEVEAPALNCPDLRTMLARKVSRERLRTFEGNNRIRDGIASWPLGWLKGAGIVCYERARGRIVKERPGAGGVPPASFVRSLVRQTDLLTSVGGTGDHYVVVQRGKAHRWATVQEVARSMEVPSGSRLMHALRHKALTAAQAAAALGRGVHLTAARALIRPLVGRGVIAAGATYASAWSGIDMFAAALDEELAGAWTYEFACESDEALRTVLTSTWGARGLAPARCYDDAKSTAVAAEGSVDVYFVSPECTKFSKRNHLRDAALQSEDLQGVARGLAYVRNALPRVVVVENVPDCSVVGPLDGLLRRTAAACGYTLRGGDLDPGREFGALAHRDRHWWVLERADAL